jgi:hypothetical protein
VDAPPGDSIGFPEPGDTELQNPYRSSAGDGAGAIDELQVFAVQLMEYFLPPSLTNKGGGIVFFW